MFVCLVKSDSGFSLICWTYSCIILNIIFIIFVLLYVTHIIIILIIVINNIIQDILKCLKHKAHKLYTRDLRAKINGRKVLDTELPENSPLCRASKHFNLAIPIYHNWLPVQKKMVISQGFPPPAWWLVIRRERVCSFNWTTVQQEDGLPAFCKAD